MEAATAWLKKLPPARARVRRGSWQSKGWHFSPPVPAWAVGCHRFDPWLVLWFPIAHQGCRLRVNSTLGVFAVRARPGACLSCPTGRVGFSSHFGCGLLWIQGYSARTASLSPLITQSSSVLLSTAHNCCILR